VCERDIGGASVGVVYGEGVDLFNKCVTGLLTRIGSTVRGEGWGVCVWGGGGSFVHTCDSSAEEGWRWRRAGGEGGAQ
jgi:hypothetical protein